MDEGHFGLPTFRFISITAFDALPADDLGIRYARPEMMALASRSDFEEAHPTCLNGLLGPHDASALMLSLQKC
jgi:hypothetical protein